MNFNENVIWYCAIEVHNSSCLLFSAIYLSVSYVHDHHWSIQGLSLDWTVIVDFGIHSLSISDKVFVKISFVLFILSRSLINDQSDYFFSFLFKELQDSWFIFPKHFIVRQDIAFFKTYFSYTVQWSQWNGVRTSYVLTIDLMMRK